MYVVPVLHRRDEELQEPIMREFMGIEEYRYYVEDREVSQT